MSNRISAGHTTIIREETNQAIPLNLRDGNVGGDDVMANGRHDISAKARGHWGEVSHLGLLAPYRGFSDVREGIANGALLGGRRRRRCLQG